MKRTLFAVTLLAATSLGAAAPSLDDLFALAGVGGVAMAPDGAAVAYVLSREGRSEIRIVQSDGGGDRTLAEGAAPQFSPDGRTVAYFSAQSGSKQLWIVPVAGGEPRKLSDHAEFLDRFQWAPDGRRIAFLARPRDQADLRYFVRQRAEGEPTVVDVNNLPKNRLWVVDVTSAETRALTSDEYSVGGYEQWFPDGFSWSPDSRRIAFSKRAHAKAGGHLYSDIAIVEAASGEVRTLVEREGMDGHPQWSPDGSSIAFIATDRVDWVTVSYLYRIDLESGREQKLTPEFDEKIGEFFWVEQGRRIVFLAGEGVARQAFSLDVEARQVSLLSSGTDVYGGLSLSADGRSLAFVRENAVEPPDVYTARLADFRPKRLTHVNPQIAEWPAIETEVMRWKSFDGMTIEGLLHKPLGYRAGERYPLLVVPHGGPHGVMTNTFVDGEYRIFADRGWLVFRPNFRGSGHYGEKFLRANLGGWGLGDYQDLMSGVDDLIERGLADPERMAIAGASYGGYMTSWTISQTNRFRAAVVGAAITDVPSFVRTTDVPDRFEDYLGKDPRNYERSSPMYYADNIRTPALIWHGDGDIRVPLMQGRHLYTALRSRGVPTEFLIYHGEAHGLSKRSHQRDLLERKIRWLDRWVLGRGEGR